MTGLIGNVHAKVRAGSEGTVLYIFKCFTGLVVGLTFALIGQEIFEYESLSFTLVSVVLIGIFLRSARRWGVVGILVFNLIFVLVAMLLRMYILVAPGA